MSHPNILNAAIESHRTSAAFVLELKPETEISPAIVTGLKLAKEVANQHLSGEANFGPRKRLGFVSVIHTADLWFISPIDSSPELEPTSLGTNSFD